MRSRRRQQNLIVRVRRALIVAPTLAGYVIMMLGITIPARAAQEDGQRQSCQHGVCCCGKAGKGTTPCRCCCARGRQPKAAQPDQPVSSIPAPKSDCARHTKDPAAPRAGHVSSVSAPQTTPVKPVTWPLFVVAPPCSEQAKLWLADNPPSLPTPVLSWQADERSIGWLPLVGRHGPLVSTPPPAPPPRA